MRSLLRQSVIINTLAISKIITIHRCHAFVPSPLPRIIPPYSTTIRHMSSSSSTDLPEVAAMRIVELKKELESYGISTKSFLEKKELIEAVDKARSEGKKPVATTTAASSSSDSSSSSSPSSSEPSASPSSAPSESREEQLAKAMKECRTMKAGDLKSELESYGISTKSFFEKSEFVKACAEARVDGAASKSSSSSGGASGGKEGYAEYADVEVLTSDDAGPRKKSDPNQQQGGGGGGSPFGGGGAPGGMGGMGGMGGIADMLKNMGGMGGMGGGGGGAPGGMGGMEDILKNMGGMGGMGGGGGMPGGANAMKKAQELMTNPKAREIMAKAQSNPKIMAAMTECMSNPAAFAKYQNDPEIGSLMRELQEIM